MAIKHGMWSGKFAFVLFNNYDCGCHGPLGKGPLMSKFVNMIMTSEVSRMKVSENIYFYDFGTFQIRFAVTILLWFGFTLMILIWFQLRF